MRGLGALSVALGVVSFETPPAFAAVSSEASAAQTYTFAFHDADIAQVAEAILGGALGVTYTIDPTVSGKMSFRIEKRLTKTQLLAAFEAALRTSDLAMVRQGDGLLVEPRAKARSSGGLGVPGSEGHGVGYSTLAVPLTYAIPSEVAKALQAVTGTDSVVFVDDKQGLLILGGDPPELEAAVQMVRTLDHGGVAQSQIRFFELSQAPADVVAEDLDHLLKAAGVTGASAVPMKRLNGIFVFARSAKSLDEVAAWIAKLDVPPKETSNTFYSYHPRNVSAEDLASAVTSVISGRQQAPSTANQAQRLTFGAGGAGGPAVGAGGSTGAIGGAAVGLGGGYGNSAQALSAVAANNPSPGQGLGLANDDPAMDGLHIGFDRGSNTVLVMASPAKWIQLQKMLQEIDRAPSQVLIEATILEVTLNNTLSAGVDWSVVSPNGQVAAQSINSASGTVGPSTPGFSVTFLGKNVQAAIHALQSNGVVEVVSSPKILALDNHQAQLQVGDEVPIVTQTGQSTSSPGAPIVNSVNYLNTGVILNVTPRISGERIYLDIDQEVSATSTNSTSGIDSPMVQQRRLQTSFILENGGLAALGGLISSDKTTTDSGFPFLKNIPVLGLLFKTASKTVNRTELIVLITAKVVTDRVTSDRVLNDLMADMKEITRRGLIRP